MTQTPMMNLKNEEINQCPITNHEENEVNNLTYNELFLIYKKLDNESSKLQEIVYVSKSSISSLKK